MTPRRRDVVKYGIAGLATAVGITGAASARPGKGNGNGPKGKAAHVNFLDQTVEPDSNDEIEVTVKQAFLPDGGFVVIHADGDPFGGVVGNSEYLGPGTHTDVTVSGIPADEVTDEDGDGDPELVAMAHKDTGESEVYEFPAADPPYVDKDGPVIDSAVITVEQD